MIKTINKYDFSNEFKHSDTYKDKFTIEALDALFTYFEELEENGGSDPIELDIVVISCEWTEYESLAELQGDHPSIKDMDDLNDHTTVIPVGDTGRFIIANY